MPKAMKPPRWLGVGSAAFVALLFLILSVVAAGFQMKKKPVEKFETCAAPGVCSSAPAV